MEIPRVRKTNEPKRREGRPTEEPIFLTLNRAAQESGVHREQLERRRKALGIEPDPDTGKYTLAQVFKLVHGDKEAETIGKLAAERRNIEIRNAELEGELVPTSSVATLIELALIPIRQKICVSSIPQHESREILEDIVRLQERDWAQEVRDAERRKR